MDYSLKEDIFDHLYDKAKLLFFPVKENDYRPVLLDSKYLFYVVLGFFFIKAFFGILSLNLPQNIFFADITKTAILSYINSERNSLGEVQLKENDKLNEAAMLKAKDMMTYGYFAHNSPSGITPWFWFSKVGYSYKYAGENLAIGFLESDEVYNAWLNSQSHKDNMLNPNYKEVGTAILEGSFNGNKTTIIVQLFGNPQTVKIPTVVKATTKPKTEVVKVIPKAQTEPITPKDKEPEVVRETVLSETAEYPVIKKADDYTIKDLEYFKFIKFVNSIVYGNGEILRNINYVLLALISIMLLINIIFNFQIQHADLILRSLLIVIILAILLFINKDIITQIIPHQINI